MTEHVYEAVLILGGGINLDGSLSDAAKQQVQKSVEAYNTFSVRIFITSGLYGYKGVEKPITSEAKAYARYAESIGIPSAVIYTEEHSQETLGNILFTKMEILIPLGLTRLIVVPQVNHLTERVEYLLQKVLGPGYEWKIIRPAENLDERNVLREKKSLEMTRHINDAFQDGDHQAIYKGLMKSHPAYGGTLWTTEELRKLLG